MLKKVIMLVLLLSVGLTVTNFAVPAPYVEWLYNDKNYPIVSGRQGIGYYLDLTSLYVIKDDQFGIEFEVNVLSVNHNREDSKPIVWTFHYFKNYLEPNSIYYIGNKKNKYSPISWSRRNLSDRVGSQKLSNGTFQTCMQYITGRQYRY